MPASAEFRDSEQLHQAVQDKVAAVLTKKGKEERRASRELFDLIGQDTTIDATLGAIRGTQDHLLKTKGLNAETIHAGQRLLGDLSAAIFPIDVENKDAVELHLGPRTRPTAVRISENHRVIEERTYLQRGLPEPYKVLVRDVVPQVQDSAARGELVTIVARKKPDVNIPSTKLGTELPQMDTYLEWQKKVWETGDLDIPEGERLDRHFTLLKGEAAAPENDHMPFFNREIAGLSLAQVEVMNYPLTADNVDKVTTYILTALKATDKQTELARLAMAHVVSDMGHFDPGTGEMPTFLNGQLIANFNSWQEQFMYRLLYETDPEKLENIKKFFNSTKFPIIRKFIANTLGWCTEALRTDPDWQTITDEEIRDRHPFVARAYDAYAQKLGETALTAEYFAHYDDIVEDHSKKTLLPLLRERLISLKLYDKGKSVVQEMEKTFNDTVLGITRTQELQNLVRSQPEFTRLDELIDEFTERTKGVWREVEERGLQATPSSLGVDVAVFFEGDLPYTFGVREVFVNQGGEEQDWAVNLRFNMDDRFPDPIIGKLTKDGKLVLATPLIDKVLPGFFTMIEHVGVLATRDLSVLAINEKNSAVQRRHEQQSDHTIEEKDDKAEPLANEEETEAEESEAYQRVKISFGKIPRSFTPRRVSSASEVIRKVTEKRKREFHTVGLHRRELTGTAEYEQAANLYRSEVEVLAEAWKNPDVSEDDLAVPVEQVLALRENLGELRTKMWKMSIFKSDNWPSRLRREPMKPDPLDKVIYDRRTWVDGYRVPKPPPEQIADDIKHERYYIETPSTSALATLEELRGRLGLDPVQRVQGTETGTGFKLVKVIYRA